MKTLIWIGCFLVATILNVLLGSLTGFRIGYLLFYIVVSYIAKSLCNALDKKEKKKKEAWNAKLFAVEGNAETERKIYFCEGCDEVLPYGNQTCRVCGATASDTPAYRFKPIEKSEGFVDKNGWEPEIATLKSKEIYRRYRNKEEWHKDYRYLCYKELQKRQQGE